MSNAKETTMDAKTMTPAEARALDLARMKARRARVAVRPSPRDLVVSLSAAAAGNDRRAR